ncbi:hypothetical protein MMPV_001217 [Pyropia vietnamensis]
MLRLSAPPLRSTCAVAAAAATSVGRGGLSWHGKASRVPHGAPPPHDVRRGMATTMAPPPRSPTPAFVLDIDGVLLRGGATIRRAPDALRLLYDSPVGPPTHPLLFLTNGGGVTEAARAAALTDRLGVHVDASQVVLSHTPLAAIAAAEAKAAGALSPPPATSVLVIGGRGCADVAAGYGFRHVLAAADAARLAPSVAPFSPPRQGEALERDDAETVAALPVGSVLVMHDSTDWGRDIQLIIDALLAASPLANGAEAQKVKVVACNADLTFPADHPSPRLATGAFTTALAAVYAAASGGRQLALTRLGKPHGVQYDLAFRRLEDQRATLRLPAPTPAIYAVGDNPASDVAGANGAGGVWRSVLVRTGNWGGADNDVVHPAHHVVNDVYDAISLGLRAYS